MSARHSPNHYHTLGVPRNATAEQIRRAYRAKAKALHPDVNPSKSAAKEFAHLAAAYEVLGSTEKRRTYDRSLDRAEELTEKVSTGQAHYSWENVAAPRAAPPVDISEVDELYDTFFSRKKAGSASNSTGKSTSHRRARPGRHD